MVPKGRLSTFIFRVLRRITARSFSMRKSQENSGPATHSSASIWNVPASVGLNNGLAVRAASPSVTALNAVSHCLRVTHLNTSSLPEPQKGLRTMPAGTWFRKFNTSTLVLIGQVWGQRILLCLDICFEINLCQKCRTVQRSG